MPIEPSEIALRLGVAVIIGSALGLNRDLHGNPAGLRTHSLVSLGAAVATMLCQNRAGDNLGSGDVDSVSRVLQGILTGIGFLGAGVILQDRRGHITGLTTAAAIWLCAVLGAACGLGYWHVILIAAGLVAVVLGIGGPIERVMERLFDRKRPRERAREKRDEE